MARTPSQKAACGGPVSSSVTGALPAALPEAEAVRSGRETARPRHRTRADAASRSNCARRPSASIPGPDTRGGPSCPGATLGPPRGHPLVRRALAGAPLPLSVDGAAHWARWWVATAGPSRQASKAARLAQTVHVE